MSTNSLAFPKMFDIARNQVGVLENNESIVNRTRLLILTEPTELYNSPDFGVGLKKYLWQYNNDNVRAIIQDRIKAQLDKYEPCCTAEETSFADGLLFTGTTDSDNDPTQGYNKLEMTVGLSTIYGEILSIDISSLYSDTTTEE